MDSLVGSGWHVASTYSGPSSAKEILADVINRDIKDFGDAFLADLVAAASDSGVLSTGTRGHVLQVMKIRNVAAPKSNEDNHAAPRMLKMTLTDGHANCHAVELSKIEKIALTSAPGTKVRLRPGADLPFKNGFLQLHTGQLEVVGGRVEFLAEKWETARKLAQFTRAKNVAGAGGPPTWVPFGKKIKDSSVEKQFKELKAEKEDEDKEDTEFDSQRQDAVEEALKQGVGKKVFGGGNKEIKEGRGGRGGGGRGGFGRGDRDDNRGDRDSRGDRGERGEGGDFHRDHRGGGGGGRGGGDREDRGDRRGGRGGGRRGRDRDEDGDESGGYMAKPSGTVSLFDFVENKFPGAHDDTNNENSNSNRRGGGGDRGGDRGGERGGHRGGGDRGGGGERGRGDQSSRGRGGRGGFHENDGERGGRRNNEERGRGRGGGRGGGDRGGGDRGSGGGGGDDRRTDRDRRNNDGGGRQGRNSPNMTTNKCSENSTEFVDLGFSALSSLITLVFVSSCNILRN
jgi:tudor domain-containing protein 3